MDIVKAVEYQSTVALRKESVDRNLPYIADGCIELGSLSARRAWIEIDQIGKVLVDASGRSPQGERG